MKKRNTAMKAKNLRLLNPLHFRHVAIDDGFWKPRIKTNREVTMPMIHRHMKSSGHLDAWRWEPGRPKTPHIFWDSDLGKWLEAAAYILVKHPENTKLARQVDSIVSSFALVQAPDGYLNTHYLRVEPENRWTNLRNNHELYCAGHLMEAAVALAEAGRPKLLEIIRRYADLIAKTFGRGKKQIRGYCGHPEIELALFRLARAGGGQRDLELARFFIEERGRNPNYFLLEDRRLKRKSIKLDYTQAHKPLRKQTEAEGHAVRACYIYSAMADLAAETGDRALFETCKKIWRNIVERRMYVTGGIGSARFGERFTFDHDLPNEDAYAETCANISLVFFTHRMLQIEADAAYADVIERVLYNSAISGLSLDGTKFFYVNRLASKPEAFTCNPFDNQQPPERRPWFGCACCPPNISRTLASLGQYIYSTAKNTIYTHLFVQGRAEIPMAGQNVTIEQTTNYPWSGKITLKVKPDAPTTFTLALRIPGWCRKAAIKVNGKSMPLAAITSKGYARINRKWHGDDKVNLEFDMPVELIEAHPAVRQNAGRVAMQRGPIVYALEQADNGPNLADITLPRQAKITHKFEQQLLGGVVTLQAGAFRRSTAEWGHSLYRPVPSKLQKIRIKAVPYAVWSNRGTGEMIVWIRSC